MCISTEGVLLYCIHIINSVKRIHMPKTMGCLCKVKSAGWLRVRRKHGTSEKVFSLQSEEICAPCEL